jgi:aerobic carbon-monoxide dehydrogenase medium subunit
VKPVAFELARVSTIEQACELLADDERDIRVLAGGQSLVPMLNFRLSAPDVLVDLNHVPELQYIREENGELCVGAVTRQRVVERYVADKPSWSLLSQAFAKIGHVPIRNRGTVGGSVANADPAAELCLTSLVLNARMITRSAKGSREIPAEDWFQSYYTTAIEPGELLAEVRFPAETAGSGTGLHEVARRRGDFALVSCAALLKVSAAGTVDEVRLCYGSMGSRPLRAYATEDWLRGRAATPENFAEASESIEDQLHPGSDLHASSAYRMAVAKTLTRRALQDARTASAS